MGAIDRSVSIKSKKGEVCGVFGGKETGDKLARRLVPPFADIYKGFFAFSASLVFENQPSIFKNRVTVSGREKPLNFLKFSF